jgi:hypothetical protein
MASTLVEMDNTIRRSTSQVIGENYVGTVRGRKKTNKDGDSVLAVLLWIRKLPEEGVNGILLVVLFILVVVHHLDVEFLQVKLQDPLHPPPLPLRHQAADAGDEDTATPVTHDTITNSTRERLEDFFLSVSSAFFWAELRPILP